MASNNATLKIGQNIRKIRELKDLKREYVAQKLDISLNAYGSIERGETDLHLSRLEQISEVLGVELFRLFNFDNSIVFDVHHNEQAHTYNSVDNIHIQSNKELSDFLNIQIKNQENQNKLIESVVEMVKNTTTIISQLNKK
ncbi:MAG: helix-turn-helix domain-containing protein [Phycisphaerales bacterium]|nr:helix-turn-helix domain-containing protein [Phycisphaerales bacterium]